MSVLSITHVGAKVCRNSSAEKEGRQRGKKLKLLEEVGTLHKEGIWCPGAREGIRKQGGALGISKFLFPFAKFLVPGSVINLGDPFKCSSLEWAHDPGLANRGLVSKGWVQWLGP